MKRWAASESLLKGGFSQSQAFFQAQRNPPERWKTLSPKVQNLLVRGRVGFSKRCLFSRAFSWKLRPPFTFLQAGKVGWKPQASRRGKLRVLKRGGSTQILRSGWGAAVLNQNGADWPRDLFQKEWLKTGCRVSFSLNHSVSFGPDQERSLSPFSRKASSLLELLQGNRVVDDTGFLGQLSLECS